MHAACLCGDVCVCLSVFAEFAQTACETASSEAALTWRIMCCSSSRCLHKQINTATLAAIQMWFSVLLSYRYMELCFISKCIQQTGSLDISELSVPLGAFTRPCQTFSCLTLVHVLQLAIFFFPLLKKHCSGCILSRWKKGCFHNNQGPLRTKYLCPTLRH